MTESFNHTSNSTQITSTQAKAKAMSKNFTNKIEPAIQILQDYLSKTKEEEHKIKNFVRALIDMKLVVKDALGGIF